ncbi:MAG: S-layer homology domain-containing protein [Clostridia bacterium]|nr:S-layer homology domain-containing protein [Clostridia bacterium]
MKKNFLPFFLVSALLCALLAFSVFAADTVYVKSGAAGDGSSAENAFGDIADAVAALSGGGTVVVCGDVQLSTSRAYDAADPAKPIFKMPQSGDITLCGSYKGKNYGGNLLTPVGCRLWLSANTTFENITFTAESENAFLFFVGCMHDMTFGAGVKMAGAVKAQLIGGMQHDNAAMHLPEKNYDADVHITVQSGNFFEIDGFGRNVGNMAGGAPYSGTAYITVAGDAVVQKLLALYRYGDNGFSNASAVITLDGGAVTEYICAADKKQDYKNDITIKLTQRMDPANYFTFVPSLGWSSAGVWNGINASCAFKDYNNSGTTVLDLSEAKLVTDAWIEKAVFADSFEEIIPFDPAKVTDLPTEEEKPQKFAATRAYAENFADVTADKWFYPFVKTAYEYGLANGTSAAAFSPSGKFTVAQALTAAANIHKAYYDGAIRAAGAGESWFAPYVEYCIEYDIITARQFDDYNKNITRGQMATVFANILPEEEYEPRRSGDIPDLSHASREYLPVMKLYNAGIVGGDAGSGNFRPDDEITRAEACVIFTRIALPALRQN